MGDRNMPPGVSVNDIPGNRPEDLKYEEFWDNLLSKFNEKYGKDKARQLDELLNSSEEIYETIITDLVDMAAELSYSEGISDGREEETMRQDCDHKFRDYGYGMVCRDCGKPQEQR